METADIPGEISFEPLNERNWDKFVRLFGERGASGNCWCMYYRLSQSDFHAGQGSNGNRNAMQRIVRSGKPSGILGIINDEAVAWCAFAPRKDFIRLEKSRVHKRIDDSEVWSIPCFFIHKNYRKKGITEILLNGVIRHARENNIKVLEAYPSVKPSGKLPDSFAWYGFLDTFERAGFEIVDTTSKSRPMVRYYI